MGGGGTLGESSPKGNIDMWEYGIPAKNTQVALSEFYYDEEQQSWVQDYSDYEYWEVLPTKANVTYEYDDYSSYEQKGNNILITYVEVDNWGDKTEEETYTYTMGRYFKSGKEYKDSDGDTHVVFGPYESKSYSFLSSLGLPPKQLNDYVIEIDKSKWVDEYDGEVEYDIAINYYEKGKGFVFGYDYEDCDEDVPLDLDYTYLSACEYETLEVAEEM